LEQEVRFCAVPGGRVAYATVGSGPPLVIPALWISHVELEWEIPEFRTFISALAETHTVIRYDRLGTGLSDRATAARDGAAAASDAAATPGAAVAANDAAATPGAAGPGNDAARDGGEPDLPTLAALVDALGLERLDLLGISFGAPTAIAYAARNAERVSSLAFFGGFAHGDAIAPPALREALVATVRAHWGAGSRVLSDVWLPGANAALREKFATLQRAAASAEVAAATLEAIYATDVRDLLPSVPAPAVVIHRRRDRAIPFALGRDLAAQLPNARFVALVGELHPPWLGATAPVLAALRGTEPAPAGPLSEREREVLRLIGAGLSDGEIAAQLVVSPHTVHRHVANIRRKLDRPSRAAAVAEATRRGWL
jgi:pimeloyl-ACP methyl ester carboxylesterase/DNA-binding CsgD family transcriptional regulator